MLATTLVIVLLGALTVLVVRKLLPKITNATKKRIAVLETVHLSPRKALHLVQVGSRKLLVGSSADQIVKLEDVTDALGPDYAEAARRVDAPSKAETGEGDSPGPG